MEIITIAKDRGFIRLNNTKAAIQPGLQSTRFAATPGEFTENEYYLLIKTTANSGFCASGAGGHIISHVLLLAIVPAKQITLSNKANNEHLIYKMSSGYGQAEHRIPHLHKAVQR